MRVEIVFIDESGISERPALVRSWARWVSCRSCSTAFTGASSRRSPASPCGTFAFSPEPLAPRSRPNSSRRPDQSHF